MKIKSTLLLVCGFSFSFCLFTSTAWAFRTPIGAAHAQYQQTISGTVQSSDGQPLQGVTITLGDSNTKTSTDRDGRFVLSIEQERGNLIISHMGYQTQTIAFDQSNTAINISLEPGDNEIEEVEVVSTGYQTIPKERATGSFVQVDRELLNRRVSANLLDRLDGVTSGLIFNRNNQASANNSDISIRGRSTLSGNPDPLIVVDNFPYEGRLEGINPADVESVTVLKDAAAASIWGVRAGNGVIVITTKSGTKDQSPEINFTSNITWARPSDVFAAPWIESRHFLDMERQLFDLGYYNNTIQNKFQPITRAIDIFNKEREGTLTPDAANEQIAQLENKDVRHDLNKYFLRNSIAQQYQFTVNGGSRFSRYFISGSFDDVKAERPGSGEKRTSLYMNNSYDLIQDRLTIHSGLQYSNTISENNTMYFTPYSPYDDVSDEFGYPLEIGKFLRPSYTDTASNGQFLDWKYRPLNENTTNDRVSTDDIRINIRSDFSLSPAIKLSANYQFQYGNTHGITVYDRESFYTRDLINRFSTIDNTGRVQRAIPIGNIEQANGSNYNAHNCRLQLDYNRSFSRHDIHAVAGTEIRHLHRDTDNQILYGVNPSIATNANAAIDPTRYYTNYHSGATELIPTAPMYGFVTDRFRSIYALANWTIDKKYILTGSIRRDESNLFGVRADQKRVPLWSVGALWDLRAEDFFKSDWFDALRLRATYGYNGNVDKRTSAYLTAQLYPQLTPWGVRPREILNPPNPSLRWERVQNINVGVEFSMLSNFISGTVEAYRKSGTDLIGNSRLAPQTGVAVFTGNSANLRTDGLDIVLSGNWLRREVQWNTELLYNVSNDKVTHYMVDHGTNLDIVTRNFRNPIVGYPYNSMFSYTWRGLDSNGDPQGLLDGEVSTNYTAILNSRDVSQLTYHGAAAPTRFGSVRNTVSWKNWSFSCNIVFKSAYYIRRNAVFSGTSYHFQQANYQDRWQHPGDELLTDIPALRYPLNSARGLFFENSSALIMQGDHIRLQDIRLSKTTRLNDRIAVDIYTYINNIGIVWRANEHNIDPDYGYVTQPTSFSFGININLK